MDTRVAGPVTSVETLQQLVACNPLPTVLGPSPSPLDPSTPLASIEGGEMATTTTQVYASSNLLQATAQSNKANVRNKMRVSGGGSHSPSQADHLDNPMSQMDVFPPAPVATAVKQPSGSYDLSMRGNPAPQVPAGPMAANSLLGGAFGSLF